MTVEAPISHNDLSAIMHERRSVRTYDPTFKLSREEIKAILTDAVQAPSGVNLQSWRFLVIDSQTLKEKLLPIAFNQKQVKDASAIIAVLGDLESYKKTETIYERTVQAGYMTESDKQRKVENTLKMYESFPYELLSKYAYIDGGLVSMQLMLAAKARGYDTVAMAGYDLNAFKEAFSISERYVSVILIAIGKALKEGHPSIRMSVEEVTSWNEMTFE
ncbi:nitroreductase family protein [Paenibacillus sp. R14(2021)]|uniref:nitroreductase family protein n=1 Tax=Paenibacillus sp. R14(2021) TaxID=2859228 RepID=UPI001C611904|nr:nitroreductase family protein [Paenibacillus sp. R14(2021)]